MAKQKQKTVIDELSDQADGMLNECWKKLKAKKATLADIENMVLNWGIKHEVFQAREEEKQLKKEAKQSDS